MKRILSLGFFAGLLLIGMFGRATATTIDVGFQRVTSNVPDDIGSQLHLSILDAASAYDDHHITIGANQALFLFTNAVGITSNIAEIYLDDGKLNLTLGDILNSIGGFTKFEAGANPADLPSGDTLIPHFDADTALSVQAKAGSPDNGINTSTDMLGLIYTFLPSTSLMGSLHNALVTGELRIGLHVRSISNITSDAYVSTAPVPEPATMLLFGAGLLGLVGIFRKKREGNSTAISR